MMIRMRTTAAPLLAAALMTADAAAAQGRVVQLPERDRVLSGTAPQVFAIGAAEGAEHEMFGEIAGVAFDASDNLYVLDRPNARVMVYGPTGRFLRKIGRKGQGPGELTVPMQLAIAGDGTLVVMDLARPAYSLFRPDGTFIRNVAMAGGMPMPGSPMAWHPRGGIVGTFRSPPADNPRTGTHTENTVPLTFYSFAGGNPVRLYQIPQQWTTQSSSSGANRMQIRMSPPPTFSPAVLFGVLPGGQMALSFTSGYTVRILDANGQTVRYLQRPVPVRRTTERDRERARAQRREDMESGRGRITISRGGGGAPPRGAPSGPALEQMLGEMRFADTIPALRGLGVAPSGKIWVERTPRFGVDEGPVDLLTAEGQYLGTINGLGLPAAISRGGLAAFTEVDDLGVDRVVVRRLPQPWR
ncbi:MAG TPA: 6-bladed beta-propeller [Longimicrobium sp.]|nr:6-bladed beta-propeller [Longimicrobium sp.]